MTRFFRSTDATLDSVRSMLDEGWGYPNESTKTSTAIPPSAECPHDARGMVYLAVDDTYCEYMLPAQILPSLIESGQVEEITEADYRAVLPVA